MVGSFIFDRCLIYDSYFFILYIYVCITVLFFSGLRFVLNVWKRPTPASCTLSLTFTCGAMLVKGFAKVFCAFVCVKLESSQIYLHTFFLSFLPFFGQVLQRRSGSQYTSYDLVSLVMWCALVFVSSCPDNPLYRDWLPCLVQNLPCSILPCGCLALSCDCFVLICLVLSFLAIVLLWSILVLPLLSHDGFSFGVNPLYVRMNIFLVLYCLFCISSYLSSFFLSYWLFMTSFWLALDVFFRICPLSDIGPV